jgi:hypothetical protein
MIVYPRAAEKALVSTPREPVDWSVIVLHQGRRDEVTRTYTPVDWERTCGLTKQGESKLLWVDQLPVVVDRYLPQ